MAVQKVLLCLQKVFVWSVERNGDGENRHVPIVYCGESVDNIENLYSLYINKNICAKASYNEKYF